MPCRARVKARGAPAGDMRTSKVQIEWVADFKSVGSKIRSRDQLLRRPGCVWDAQRIKASVQVALSESEQCCGSPRPCCYPVVTPGLDKRLN